MKKIMVSTTELLSGWTIETYLQPIVVNIVGGAGALSENLAFFSDVFGTKSNSYQKTLDNLTDTAINELKAKAYQVNANCILAMKIDINQISGKNLQLFKVTAYGTPVRASQNSISNQREIIKLSNDSVKNEATLIFLKEFITEHGVKVKFSIEQLELVVLSKDFFFKDFIIGRLATDDAEQLDILKRYFFEIDRDQAIEALYDALIVVTSKSIISLLYKIITEGYFWDYLKIKLLLSNKNLEIKKHGLEIMFAANKAVYTESDIAESKDLLAVIDDTFINIGQLSSKKTLMSGEKEIWICACGRENSIKVAYCEGCQKDIKGFSEQDTKIDKVKSKLIYRIKALEDLISKESM